MRPRSGLIQTSTLHQAEWRTWNEHGTGAGCLDVRRDRWQGDHLRDGQVRQAGGRRSRRSLGRHNGSGDGRRPSRGARGSGLLPAHRRRRRARVRRGEDPRRLLQAGRARHRARDADRTHDRPPDPAALAEGLPQRGAGDLHGAVGRPDHPARHPLHQRRVRRPDALAAAVLRPGGRRPDRPDRRRVRRQPDPRAELRGVGARPDRRRHEGRPDDDRGRRVRGLRGDPARRVRARAPGDPQALRGAGGPAPARPARRSGWTWT